MGDMAQMVEQAWGPVFNYQNYTKKEDDVYTHTHTHSHTK
jgi:hypothetical protein